MTSRISDYDSAITEPSRHELASIARWLQENTQTAYLVGGWAVYYFTKQRERPSARMPFKLDGTVKLNDPPGFAALGSKDIDLVFGSKASRETFEQKYCRVNGYLPPKRILNRDLWRKHSRSAEILLDFGLLRDTWKVRKAKVDWSGLLGHHAGLEVAPGVSILAPHKELLLLYKCVALVERTDKRGLPNQNLGYLDSKIWKDANDILALHDTGINEDALTSIAEESGLQKILSAAKEIISSNYESFGFTQYAFAKNFLNESV